MRSGGPHRIGISSACQIGTMLVLLAIGGYGCSAQNTADVLGLAQSSGSSTHTVRSDGGGVVIDYALKARLSEQEHTIVRFAGRCVSACTLYLSLPEALTCIMPGAHFGFHNPIAVSPRHEASAKSFMMRDYPAWVRAWLAARGGLTDTMKYMPYSYAAQHIRRCPENV